MFPAFLVMRPQGPLYFGYYKKHDKYDFIFEPQVSKVWGHLNYTLSLFVMYYLPPKFNLNTNITMSQNMLQFALCSQKSCDILHFIIDASLVIGGLLFPPYY